MNSTQLRHVTLLAMLGAVVLALISLSAGAGAVGGSSPVVEPPAEVGDQSATVLGTPTAGERPTGSPLATSLGSPKIATRAHLRPGRVGETSAGTELAVVDTTVKDHETLARAAREAGMDVVNVSSADELTASLSEYSNLAAVHILSHGTVGTVQIGNDTLQRGTLDQYSGLTGALDSSLAADGDVLLYGCRVAENGAGRAFVGDVATATGGDVAASDDLTGNESRGGDWTLEANMGDVGSATLDNAALGQFSNTLAPSYSSASISPTTVYKGSMVDANITVTNNDGVQQTYNVSVSVDGTIEQWENGTIAANSNTDLWIRQTLWDVGDHTVTVAGGSTSATETVTVEDAMPKYHGGPRNLGHYPNQTGPTSKPVEQWNISGGVQVMQSSLVNGTIYTGFHSGKLYAIDAETGTEQWNFTESSGWGFTWSTPAYANGVVYVGSNDHKLHAIDAETGNELWNYSVFTDVRSAPAVVDGTVYFGRGNGNFTAVNATSGEKVWDYEPAGINASKSNPAVVDGVVYFGNYSGYVTALDTATGNPIWNFSTDGDPVGSDPTVVNDTVYIGSGYSTARTSGTHELYALNATDGTERWNHTMSNEINGGVAYANGLVYAASHGGDFVALDAATGNVVWDQSSEISDVQGSPVVVNGTVYVMDHGNASVHAFDASDGTELWAYSSPTRTLYSTPLVWNDRVYYGSGSALYALAEPAPSITNVSVTNPSARNLDISFDSSLQLSTISVSISGAESATLAESDFTETANGDGSYTYTASYSGSTDGTYTATVDSAVGPDGRDGASGESDSASVSVTQITDWNDLDNVRNDLDGDYVLAADLDKNSAGYSSIASDSANGGSGFDPLGDDTTSFTGSFDGNGYTISNLTISRSSTDYVGLFGYTGSGATVTNVTLADADVTGNNWVGALVGNHTGSDIRNVSADGTVTGRDYVGGVVGQIRNANLSGSSASGNVTATAEFVGGLVGKMETGGSIKQSHATSTVVANATGNTQNHVDRIGGLVGSFTGNSITDSSATGTVTAKSGEINEIGGLVGLYDGSGNIVNASASGDVSSEYKEVGGLVG
ncbi:MAG: PQQ-binding-like beta-propeller repeat protein, partial [Halobacteriales archaeon]